MGVYVEEVVPWLWHHWQKEHLQELVMILDERRPSSMQKCLNSPKQDAF